MSKKTCCICGMEFEGYGNDPWPVKENGRCCDECNWTVIVPARIRNLQKGDEEHE